MHIDVAAREQLRRPYRLGVLAGATRQRAEQLMYSSRCLARPGGNVTGLANQLSDTASKRLELLRRGALNAGAMSFARRISHVRTRSSPVGDHG